MLGLWQIVYAAPDQAGKSQDLFKRMSLRTDIENECEARRPLVKISGSSAAQRHCLAQAFIEAVMLVR